MVSDHKKDVKEFEKARKTKRSRLKAFAEKIAHAPDHLRQAENLQAQIKGK